jgi:hypothetical protein
LAEPLWHLTFTPMPARPGEPDPSVRVRRLMKHAKRALRLRCVSLKEPPPDPCAFAGWLWLPDAGAWVQACSHATEAGCRALLAERVPADRWWVLPKGESPELKEECDT